MREQIETDRGQTVIVRTEPDDSISLLVGNTGVYILASLSPQEARRIRAALLEGNRSLATINVRRSLKS